MRSASQSLPLVSVIITTYNYGEFLPKAIDSIFKQTYQPIELIVIDDGSTDNTNTIVQNYPDINYHYQSNRGLSAARNAGICKSSGELLVFLDADDWLENEALEKNAAVLIDQPELAFVSGNYFLLHAENKTVESVKVNVSGDHYEKLLRSNYIGMHGAVMYRRWVFDEFLYDEQLRSCEDYDLYLRIARRYPAHHHEPFIATYYFHNKSLSHDYRVMIDAIRQVIQKQQPLLKSNGEKRAFRKGRHQWKQYYCLQYYKTYANKKPLAILKNQADLIIFLQYDRRLLWQLLLSDFKKLVTMNGEKKQVEVL